MLAILNFKKSNIYTLIFSVIMIFLIILSGLFLGGVFKTDKQENITKANSVVQQGDWIYYSSLDKITKIKKDGTAKKIINRGQKVYDLCVVGDWIYYNMCETYGNGEYFYKIKTDGTNRKKLPVNSFGFGFFIVEDYIYYQKAYHGQIYKMRTDGTDNKLIYNDETESFSLEDGWIYYNKTDDRIEIDNKLKPGPLNGIYKMKYDGSTKTKLCTGEFYNLDVENDWIYFINYEDKGYLYKMRTDGSDKIKLVSEKTNLIDVVDDWVYYGIIAEGPESFLYKIHTDGTNNTKIYNKRVRSLIVIDDWIYFNQFDKIGYDILYKISTNGTQKKFVTILSKNRFYAESIYDAPY